MSVDNPQVFDAVGIEKDGSGVTLTIADHLEWDSREHLLKLQEQLNTYLAFIESGEIFESYPDAKGKRIKISVVCLHSPNPDGQAFFIKCKALIENAGFGFTFETHET